MSILLTANGQYPGTALRGKERFHKLYHYTSFESFVKIWLTQKLKFNSVKGTNDILESMLTVSAQSFELSPMMYAYLEIRPRYKQISFTMDYDSYYKGCMSPCMWGYYSKKDNGVCIELDYEHLQFPREAIHGPIVYKKEVELTDTPPNSVTTINQLHEYFNQNAKSQFLTKQICWKGENEYRVICFDGEFLDISRAINNVYVSTYNSQVCEYVEKIVDEKVPVKYLHYISGKDNVAIPVMTDTRVVRTQFEKAKQNPNNAITKISDQARQFYESHRNDPNYPLILQSFVL